MRFGWLALWVTLVLAVPWGSRAGEPVSIAVMEFASKGGVEQEQMDALSDMLANEITGLGEFRVIGKSDIASMLNLEQQRQRLDSCDDQSCLAEIGGALGVRWMVVGNVSLFGDTFLLNLKLVDVDQAKVAGRVSRSLKGSQSRLIAELPAATVELFEPVGEAMGLSPERLAEAQKAAALRRAEFDEESTGSQLFSGWFTRSESRQGRWQVWVRNGGTVLAPGKIDWGTNTPVEKGTLIGLESEREGFRVGLGGGYNLFDWLALSAWIGYFTGSGRGDYEDHDQLAGGGYTLDWPDPAENDEDRDLYHKRNAFEWGVEAKFSWPVDFWIEPVASVSLGMSLMEDFIPASYFPLSDGFDQIPLQGTGFLLDIGVGADIYILPRLRIGFMAMWVLRSFGTLAGDGVKWDARAGHQGGSFAASLGFTF